MRCECNGLGQRARPTGRQKSPIGQGRPAEAKAKLDALIKIAPNSDGAVIAKELLASLSAKP